MENNYYKFVQISDIHIRNFSKSDEYDYAFSSICKSLEKIKPDFIFLCGDLAHNKLSLSPEYFNKAYNFLYKIQEFCDVITILGQHDLNLNNPNRLDAVSPIVSSLNETSKCFGISLKKESEYFELNEDIGIGIFSCLNKRNSWPFNIPESKRKKINIALAHGIINGCKTDSGFELKDSVFSEDDFKEYDFVFLGDIHKRQLIGKEGKIGYPGNVVCSQFGEDVDKSFSMWRVNKNDPKDFYVEYIPIDYKNSYYTFNCDENSIISHEYQNIKDNSNIRVFAPKNFSFSQNNDIRKQIKNNFKANKIIILNENIEKSNKKVLDKHEKYSGYNLRDKATQEKLISDYLINILKINDQEIIKKVIHLNGFYEEYVDKDSVRNVTWKLKKMWWNNFFNYGSDNEINFNDKKGLFGIFGPNKIGKSSIFEVLSFIIFAETIKEFSNFDLINENEKEASGGVVIEFCGDEYVIERKLVKTNTEKQTAVSEVNFYKNSEQKVILNGEKVSDTNKNIRKYFGKLEDFIITSFCPQFYVNSFIKEKPSPRAKMLMRLLDIEFFEEKFQIANEDMNALKKNISDIEPHILKSYIEKTVNEIKDKEELVLKNQERIDYHKIELSYSTEQALKLSEQIVSSVPESLNLETIEKELFDIKNKKEEKIKEAKKIVSRIKKGKKIIKEGQDNEINQKKNISNLREEVLKYNKIKENEIELQSKLVLINNNIENEEKYIKNSYTVPCSEEYQDKCLFLIKLKDYKKNYNEHKQEATSISNVVSELIETLKKIDIKAILSSIKEYDELCESNKRNQLKLSNFDGEKNKIIVELNSIKLLKRKIENNKEEYFKNEQNIKNNKELRNKISEINKKNNEIEEISEKIQKELNKLREEIGQLKGTKEEDEKKYKKIVEDTLEADILKLFLKTQNKKDGIPFLIMNEKITNINDELSKISDNIGEFRIFFEYENKVNELGGNLKLFIQSGEKIRPASTLCGYETIIASLVIRIVLTKISSLPQNGMLILDESTANSDTDNLERLNYFLLDLKNYFDIIMIISHQDTVREIIDQEVIIEKIGEKAKIIS